MSSNFAEIRDAQRDFQEWLDNSPPYRFCASLPLPKPVKRFFSLRVKDIVETVAELSIIGLLIFQLWMKEGYYGANWRRHQKTSFIADVKVVLAQHNFDEMIALCFPRTYGWYKLFNAQWILLKWRTRKIRAGVRWLIDADHKKVFRVLFGTSPADAARGYQIYDLPHNDPFTSKFAYGSVRFHFFTSLEKGKSKKRGTPYISVDLKVEKKGVNLSLLRKTWGLDSLAIIANVDPFRIIFTPADEDWLSPMAAYDLSNQFTTPIRVYEPRISALTSITRKVHDSCYPTVYGLFAFPMLVLGFTNDKPEYHDKLSILYGSQNAQRYRKVARFTRPFNYWAIEAFCALSRFTLGAIILPIIIGYQVPFRTFDLACFLAKALSRAFFSVGKLLFVMTQDVAYHLSVMIQAILVWFVQACVSTISTAFNFVGSCETRHLFIAALLIWGALAEIHSFMA